MSTTRDAPDLVTAALHTLHRTQAWVNGVPLSTLPEVKAITEASDELRRACILNAARRRDNIQTSHLLSTIARKRLDLSADDVEQLLSPRATNLDGFGDLRHGRCLQAVSRLIEFAFGGLSDVERQRLRPLLLASVPELVDIEGGPQAAARLRRLAGEADELRLDLIAGTDEVGPRLQSVFESADEPKPALAALIDVLAASPSTGRPSAKWLAEAGRVQSLLARPSTLFAALLDAALDAPDAVKQTTYEDGRTHTWANYLERSNESFLCGIVITAGKHGDADLVPLLRKLAVKTVAMINPPYGGPRSLRIANASAQAIADIAVPSSITELLALERSVRHGGLLKQIRRAVETVAEAQGMTRSQLLERAVETHELDPDGTRSVPLSRGSAVIETDGRTATLGYVDQNGRLRKSVPAEVKQTDAETLILLRHDLKAIRTTIAGERVRLENLLSLERRWSPDEWRTLYLDHPVTGRLARATIWRFGEEVVGLPLDATTALTGDGDVVAIPAEAEVRMWHPIEATTDEIRRWRTMLIDRRIVQPFKQAFRELYVLTPAERQTRSYSNRFAGHVFKQVQARALMKGRGWSTVALAWWDDGIDHGVARRDHETFGVRAEFSFDPIIDIQDDSTELYPYCTSDQVRFCTIESGDGIDLADVPPVVLTETMRDVDLFIGVTSVGADPQWLDRGTERRFDGYWNDFGFGELSAGAEIRREVLAGLVPRLAIAERCEIQDRYLRVRGDLREYRIHLGSGNILMAPDDQYLCIVAARDVRTGKLFLPFDDDPVLSVVLSKAFLLADDTAITDPTIVAQIRRD